jgi:hypothetical protein
MKKLTPEEKKRLAQIELWYRGILSFKFHKAQKIIDDIYSKIAIKLFVCNCARQFGKSFWAACKAIEMAISKPNAIIIYGAAFYKDLIKYIIPAFKKIMDGCPKDIKGEYKSSSFEFPNGSIIHLVGVDKNPDGLRGNTIDMYILDECGYIKALDYIYSSIIIPATTHRPNAKIIFISTPPNTPDHPFTDFCHQAQKDNAYAVFTIYDNPMLSEQAIDKLAKEVGGKDSTTWKREYLCKFVTDQNLKIIPEWLEDEEWEKEYVKELPTDQFYEFYHRYVCMDLGFVDFTALLFGYYDWKRAALIIQDEFQAHGPSANSASLHKQITEIEQRLWGTIQPRKRIADNNNPQFLNEFLVNHQMVITPTSKENLDAMINEVKLWVSQGKLIINPKCKQLIGCLKYGVWDSTKKRVFARSKTYGHYDHLAALIYMIRNIDTTTNPIPPTLGLSHQTHWMKNLKNKQNVSQSMQNLAAAFPKGNN